MDKQQRLLLKEYIDLLYRWKMLLIILLLISLPAGLLFYIKTPKVYMASSLLSYQQQKVSPNAMSPDVQSRIKDIVSTLSQIVLSRTNLEGLIKDFNLYGETLERFPMEDVIDMMRKNISISPSRRGDTFLISFTGKDPEKVVKVTNALAAKFIEENLKYRQERATETSAYTSNELAMAKATMDAKEAAMRDYKLKYYNEMPEQRETNISRLVALQEQYQGMQANILELERNRVMIQEQIALRKKAIAAESSAEKALAQSNRAPTKREMEIESTGDRLRRLNLYLDSLLVKYTENHPEVKRTRKIIKNTEEEYQKERSLGDGMTAAGGGVNYLLKTDKDLLEMQNQIMETAFKIEALEREKQLLAQKIEKYEEWIAATPEREAEWASLTREYSQLKNHYDRLVAQDLQAKSMLNLERRQKGSQFKVEDPARIPETPVEPNFLKIMVLFIAAGLGSGVGVILFVGFIDGSFRDPEEVEPYLGVPVVSTVAFIPTPKENRKDKLMAVGSVVVVMFGGIMVAGLFWYAWSGGKILI